MIRVAFEDKTEWPNSFTFAPNTLYVPRQTLKCLFEIPFLGVLSL